MNSPTAYAGWRAAALAASFLHENRPGAPGERFLHLVWQHQRLRADQLVLADQRPVRILHPGFWNRGAGPDFRNAVIRIAGEPAQSGDVEIDLRRADWRAHQHHVNPRYNHVVLHVIWEAGPTEVGPSGIPELPLAGRLDGSLDELLDWIDLDPGLPDNVIGRCASALRREPPGTVVELLQQAALFRFRRKSAELSARAREAGWEQALWEGLGGALGYEHNGWPMRRLLERRSAFQGAAGSLQPLALQARLLGCSGLLPHESSDGSSPPTDYLRQLWAVWWRERHALEDTSLPVAVWRLGGTRPANHPQRRLALLAHWLGRRDLVSQLETWFSAPPDEVSRVTSLLNCLQVADDPFWSWHWTLASKPMRRAQPLLGSSRVTDLAVNVLLPWFHARAAAGGNEQLQGEAVRRFLDWPQAQDNAVLRLARIRLFGGTKAGIRWSAARQQGLLQFVRDFCGHSNALCDACVLPSRLCAAVPSCPQSNQE